MTDIDTITENAFRVPSAATRFEREIGKRIERAVLQGGKVKPWREKRSGNTQRTTGRQDRLNAIVSMIHDKSGITRADLGEALGVSKSSIQRDETTLKFEGRIESVMVREGSRKLTRHYLAGHVPKGASQNA